MGIAERIYEAVKDLPESQAAEIRGYVEHVKARCDGCSCPAMR